MAKKAKQLRAALEKIKQHKSLQHEEAVALAKEITANLTLLKLR